MYRYALLWLSSIVAVWPTNSIFSQNLVLNPGFEDHSACPSFINQVNLASYWSRPTPGTSDYFNSCATFAGVDVPASGFGDQVPFDGEAYVGLVTYVDTNVYGGFANYREYVAGQLSEPLQGGKFYSVSFQVSVADQYRYGTDNLGLYFSDTVLPWAGSLTEYPALGEAPYSMIPQVEYTGLPIDNGTDWVAVTEEFQADGGEQAFILGNFRSDHVTSRADVYPWATAMAYLFIDAISVERIYIAPMALPDSGSTTGSTPVLISVLDNDSDRDGILDPASLSIISAPMFGSANLEPATGEIWYTAFAGSDGVDSFFYKICDEEGLCDTTWVQISVLKEAVVGPIAVDDMLSTDWLVPVSYEVMTNDVPGTSALDPNTLQVIDAVEGGTTTVNPIFGTINFQPSVNFCNTAILRYLICDEGGLCDSASVVIQVACEDAICIDDEVNVTASEEISIPILLNDRAGNGSWITPTLSLQTEPTFGQVVLQPNGEVYYEAGPQSGTDRFRYEICDEAGQCDQAWITVRIAEEPVAPVQPELFIPDIITPNGDGFNDQWVLSNIASFDQHDIQLFSRWDTEIFHTRSYAQNWNGDNLPDGTYFYIIRVSKGAQQWTYTGALTLLR